MRDKQLQGGIVIGPLKNFIIIQLVTIIIVQQ